MKKVKFIGIMLILILIFTSTLVFAEDTFEIELQKSASELQRGDEFNVKLIVHENTADKDIQGIETKLNYNTSVFELQKNNTNLDAYTENGTYDVTVTEEKIVIMDNSLNSIQNDVVIVTIPFKVKNDANYGKSIISLDEIVGSHIELETDNSVSYPGTSNEIEVNVVEQKQEEPAKLNEIRVTTNPTNMEYEVGEKFNPEGMIVEAFYSDNSSSVITNYTYSPKDELKETDNKIYITYKEGNETKETTINIKVNNNNNSNNNVNDTADNNNGGEKKDNSVIENEKQNNQTIEKSDSKIEENTTQKSNEIDGKLPKTGMIGIAIPVVLISSLVIVAIILKKKYNNLNF